MRPKGMRLSQENSRPRAQGSWRGVGKSCCQNHLPSPASCQSAHTSRCLQPHALMGTVWATISFYRVHWLQTGAPQRRWLQPLSPKNHHHSAPGQTRVSSSRRFPTTQHLPAKEGVLRYCRVKCLIKACVQTGADVGAADELRQEKWGT